MPSSRVIRSSASCWRARRLGWIRASRPRRRCGAHSLPHAQSGRWSWAEPLLAARTRGRDLLAVTADGDVVTAPDGSSRVVERVSTGVRALEASFANDGTALVTGRDGRARVVYRDGSVRAIPGVVGATSASLSPDGALAAVAEPDGVRLLEVESGRVLEAYPHTDAVSTAISPDNRRVLTGGRDDVVNVWSGQSGRRVHTLTDHTGRPVALAFSPDGQLRRRRERRWLRPCVADRRLGAPVHARWACACADRRRLQHRRRPRRDVERRRHGSCAHNGLGESTRRAGRQQGLGDLGGLRRPSRNLSRNVEHRRHRARLGCHLPARAR